MDKIYKEAIQSFNTYNKNQTTLGEHAHVTHAVWAGSSTRSSATGPAGVEKFQLIGTKMKQQQKIQSYFLRNNSVTIYASVKTITK